MDLNNLDSVAACERGTDIIIKDANDIETDIVISAVGIDSKTYRTEFNKLTARLEQARKRGKPIVGEEAEDLGCWLLARCTSGWKNLTLNGKEVLFSVEKAHEIYTNYPLIKAQVFAEINNRAAFLGNVEMSS